MPEVVISSMINKVTAAGGVTHLLLKFNHLKITQGSLLTSFLYAFQKWDL